MKAIYKKRRRFFIEQLTYYFKDDILIKGDDAGMHLLVEFIPKRYAKIDWSLTKGQHIIVHPIQKYTLKNGSPKQQIVLGYGNLKEGEIKIGLPRLYQFIEQFGGNKA